MAWLTKFLQEVHEIFHFSSCPAIIALFSFIIFLYSTISCILNINYYVFVLVTFLIISFLECLFTSFAYIFLISICCIYRGLERVLCIFYILDFCWFYILKVFTLSNKQLVYYLCPFVDTKLLLDVLFISVTSC